MEKRHRRHEDDNDPADRWLVSYADFITLLFAFFVVMYAISLQGGQYNKLSQSLDQAMHKKTAEAAPTQLQTEPAEAQAAPEAEPEPEPEVAPESDDMRLIAEQLSRRLTVMLRQNSARVRGTPKGVYVEINAGLLFAPGEASLNAEAMQALRSVADVLRTNPNNTIQVAGHTDSLDIHSIQYPSNWELSTARSSSVVRLFAEAGINQERLTAIGYAATRPVADNGTPDGRLRNRRVEIQILPLSKRDAPPPTPA